MNGSLTHMGRPKKPELSEPVRVPGSVVKKIRRIAVHLGVDPGDWIAEQLAGAIQKAEAKMLAEIVKEKRPGEVA